MSEFFAMGGYAAYVWSSFGLTLVVLVGNWWQARARLGRIQRGLIDEWRRDEQQPAATITETRT